MTARDADGDILLLAELIGHLPESTIVDLHRLLDQHLGARPAPLRRQDSLGLLLSLMLAWSRIPSEAEYADGRSKAKEDRGEDWPSVTTLAERFGRYLLAADAAWKLHQHGPTAGGVSWRSLCGRPRELVTREDIVDAYIRCYETLGSRWPGSEQYSLWASLSYELDRGQGGARSKTRPPFPSTSTVEQHFGSHAHALAEAQRQLLAREEGAAATTSVERKASPRTRRRRHRDIDAASR